MKKHLIISCVVLLLLGYLPATAKPRELLGLRLGMSEDAVRDRLRKIGTQREEEKEKEVKKEEQEVWILDRHRKFDYLVARFDDQHRLSFVTVVVRKEARMRYSEVAKVKDARHATDGRNHTYTWTVAGGSKQAGYRVVARGSDPEFLTSYSLYPLGAKQTGSGH